MSNGGLCFLNCTFDFLSLIFEFVQGSPAMTRKEAIYHLSYERAYHLVHLIFICYNA